MPAHHPKPSIDEPPTKKVNNGNDTANDNAAAVKHNTNSDFPKAQKNLGIQEYPVAPPLGLRPAAPTVEEVKEFTDRVKNDFTTRCLGKSDYSIA